jgi:hypothetical protein
VNPGVTVDSSPATIFLDLVARACRMPCLELKRKVQKK